MSRSLVVRIRCDRCPNAEDLGVPQPAAGRESRQRGWATRGSQDLCPECVGALAREWASHE